ncbi:HlyD family secretion protein [Rosistilla carotiformis]|uniref:HlyD family secretion protein n=1 Tax=Rosistilla carotiformis TaxID=2528017 RepID=A0A518JRV9_9BACT|nr:efflux RND transporter periplasmic adaptor subunit [Rosistilla carotiformis]QDV68267.1 HlyD family secretion protein [Rosistilla carotiformis]
MLLDSPLAGSVVTPSLPAFVSAAAPIDSAVPESTPTQGCSGSASVRSMTALIQRLFSRYDAISLTHWTRTSTGQLTGNSLHGASSAEVRKKAASVALQSLATAETQSQILTAGGQQFLVAASLPSIPGEAISVLFRCENCGNAAQWFESRTREVELAAAHLAIITRLETAAVDRGDVTAADPSEHRDVPSPPTLPLRTRLLRAVADKKQDARWIVGICAATLLIGAIPWQHSIRCNVICEPAERRFVVAPFDGRLLKSLVGPGDQVAPQQVLATLDGGELRTQIASLQAKLDQAVQRRSAALSSGDGSKSQLERLEVQHLRSEIALLTSRQNHLEIRSPIAGIVISGDLKRAEGIPLQVGENLYEIAPLNRLVAEIAIPESDVSNVQIGMPTTIRLDAVAGTSHQTSLTQIHPRAEIRDNESVFVAEAAIDNHDLALRPGMHGTASIAAGQRSIAWLLFHRPYDALRGWIGW